MNVFRITAFKIAEVIFITPNCKPWLKEKCEQKFLVSLNFFVFQDPIILLEII